MVEAKAKMSSNSVNKSAEESNENGISTSSSTIKASSNATGAWFGAS